ncbi:MAG: quinate 5-dehydrogenase [Firmicutes bacterium ML8_F2]|nr:MAG: quinate 5-dehydrogenase [Firmicutes bacterium ML8_F2]
MKRIVGISLGSSSRDHAVTVELNNEQYRIERIGTDSDMNKMIEKIRELDGKVDAFGLGGMDLYIYAVDRRYEIRDARRIVRAAEKTPIVDGSGLKNTLERRSIEYLNRNTELFKKPQKVLLMCAMDRMGMAQALEEAGCIMTYGDLAFIIGLPVFLSSLKTLAVIARVLAPPIGQLPFTMIYPTGDKQSINKPRFRERFLENDIIAGDFHFIRRFMPEQLPGKTIITNTVTRTDIDFLKERKVKMLITTTPEMEGRSFGTNVMEALLVSMVGGKHELTEKEYNDLLKKLDLKPRVVDLQLI